MSTQSSQPLDTHNALDLLESLAYQTGATCSSVEVRRRPEGSPDAALFVTGERGASSVRGRLSDLLSSRDEIAVVRRRGRKFLLRFADDFIASLGARLEEGQPRGLRTADLLAGRSFLVDFCDPNATKALHVGHLRNLFLGNALGSALAAGGARVARQSLVCDIGRTVCEAMAGYIEHRDAEDPVAAGVKSDHFVGRCYAAYVRSLGDAPDLTAANEPVGRELATRSDLAERLLQRWQEGDREVHDLWTNVRDWVLEGQKETLERLGIHIDRPLYESEALGRARELVAQGLDRGLFHREANGGIAFATGREEYRTMPLVRDDGFPTEHLRLAAIWHDLQDEGAQVDGCIHVMGDEWVAPISTREQMLSRLRPCPLYEVYHKLAYGMVSYQGSMMKSSLGHAVLVDELLDRLVRTERVMRLGERAGGASASDTCARIALAGFLLSRKAAKPLDFSWERLLAEDQNPGWLWANAWARLEASSPTGTCDPDPGDPHYRFAVLTSQVFRRQHYLAVSTYDLQPWARYLTRVTKWHSAIDADPRLDRLVSPIVHAALSGLGLLNRIHRPS